MAEIRACPYCFAEIDKRALRCPHCSGELRACQRCGENVGFVTRQKFVGLLRGGMKTQLRCMTCDLVLDGPRW